MVDNLPQQLKRYSDKQKSHLNKPEKNQDNNKVDSSLYPKLDSAVKVRNFIDDSIKECNVILVNIDSDFDKAKRQIVRLKDAVIHLSKEIKIANSNEILSDLNINFTVLEALQDPSIDIKAITKSYIKKAQNGLKDLSKEIQSTNYISYNKPKIIVIVRYILECFRSLFNSIFKNENVKSQDQYTNQFADNQEKYVTIDNPKQSSETTLGIEKGNKQDNVYFDAVSKQDKNIDSNLTSSETATNEDGLKEDKAHLKFVENIADNDIKNSQDVTKNSKTRLDQTVTISNSTLTNYGNTCWLNSSIKALYVLYNDAIKTKAENLLENPQISLQEKQLYESVLSLFNKLDTQEDASQEISKFLEKMFIYGRSVVLQNKQDPSIENIYDLIEDIIFTVKKVPDGKKQRYNKCRSCKC